MRGFDIGFEKHVKWGFQYISRFSFLFELKIEKWHTG